MNRLQKARKQLNLSQKDLSQKIGVSRSTLAMWETGGSQPDNESLKVLADVLNVSTDYLLERTDCFDEITQTPNYSEEINAFEYNLIKAYRQHPEYHASINTLLGITPVEVAKIDKSKKSVFIAAASGKEYDAQEPDIKTMIEIEKLEKKHNK